MALQLSRPELVDHLDCLLESILTLDHPRPALAGDVLVEVLAAADAEREATRQELRGRGGRLGDDRRMDSRRRTGNPVISSIRSVRWEIAPSVPQAKGLSPCASIQGWKWSEIEAKSKPTCSARSAWATRSGAANSSLERV
jgi:hypothetical protein